MKGDRMKKPLPPPDWVGLLAGIAAEDPQRMIDLFANGCVSGVI